MTPPEEIPSFRTYLNTTAATVETDCRLNVDMMLVDEELVSLDVAAAYFKACGEMSELPSPRGLRCLRQR